MFTAIIGLSNGYKTLAFAAVAILVACGIIFGISSVLNGRYNAGVKDEQTKVIVHNYKELLKGLTIRERSGVCYDLGKLYDHDSGECK